MSFNNRYSWLDFRGALHGTYTATMDQVRGFCKAAFGYELPEKIGKFFLKGYRYRAGKGLAAVGPVISQYHEERIKG